MYLSTSKAAICKDEAGDLSSVNFKLKLQASWTSAWSHGKIE
jgi:hypothetical protein